MKNFSRLFSQTEPYLIDISADLRHRKLRSNYLWNLCLISSFENREESLLMVSMGLRCSSGYSVRSFFRSISGRAPISKVYNIIKFLFYSKGWIYDYT